MIWTLDIVFIGILPSHNLGTTTKLSETNLNIVDTLGNTPLHVINILLNGGKVFEASKIFLLWIRFSVDTLDVLVNHLSPHSLHTPPQRHLCFLAAVKIGSVYKYIDFSEST